MGTVYNKSTDLLGSLWQKSVARWASMQSFNNYVLNTNCIPSPCSLSVREREHSRTHQVQSSSLSQDCTGFFQGPILGLTCVLKLPTLQPQGGHPQLTHTESVGVLVQLTYFLLPQVGWEVAEPKLYRPRF